MESNGLQNAKKVAKSEMRKTPLETTTSAMQPASHQRGHARTAPWAEGSSKDGGKRLSDKQALPELNAIVLQNFISTADTVMVFSSEKLPPQLQAQSLHDSMFPTPGEPL